MRLSGLYIVTQSGTDRKPRDSTANGCKITVH